MTYSCNNYHFPTREGVDKFIQEWERRYGEVLNYEELGVADFVLVWGSIKVLKDNKIVRVDGAWIWQHEAGTQVKEGDYTIEYHKS